MSLYNDTQDRAKVSSASQRICKGRLFDRGEAAEEYERRQNSRTVRSTCDLCAIFLRATLWALHLHFQIVSILFLSWATGLSQAFQKATKSSQLFRVFGEHEEFILHFGFSIFGTSTLRCFFSFLVWCVASINPLFSDDWWCVCSRPCRFNMLEYQAA